MLDQLDGNDTSSFAEFSAHLGNTKPGSKQEAAGFVLVWPAGLSNHIRLIFRQRGSHVIDEGAGGEDDIAARDSA